VFRTELVAVYGLSPHKIYLYQTES